MTIAISVAFQKKLKKKKRRHHGFEKVAQVCLKNVPAEKNG